MELWIVADAATAPVSVRCSQPSGAGSATRVESSTISATGLSRTAYRRDRTSPARTPAASAAAVAMASNARRGPGPLPEWPSCLARGPVAPYPLTGRPNTSISTSSKTESV